MYERETVVNDLVKILTEADGVDCQACDVEQIENGCWIPSGYFVRVNFNIFAQAIYDAGYRKTEDRK